MSKQFEQSIVRIFDRDNNIVGTGILVGERLALTCAHVISQALFGNTEYMPANKPIEIITIDFPLVAPKLYLQCQVAYWVPMQLTGEGDIAVLELSSPQPTNAKPVYLIENDNPWEHGFKTFGCTQEAPNGLWISGKVKGRQANGWLQIESNSAKNFGVGFSGSGVWDEYLNGVSGIVVRMMQGSSNVAYVIPTHVLVTNCSFLKNCIVVSPKTLSEVYKIPHTDLQTRLALYRSRLHLLKENDLLALALILVVLKSFDESSQILAKLLIQNPIHPYAWYLYAITELKGRRPWLLNYNEVLRVQSFALKALELDSSQAHFAFLLALIKEDFFQQKGFRMEYPDWVSCVQIALNGTILKEELFLLLRLVLVKTSKTSALINSLFD